MQSQNRILQAVVMAFATFILISPVNSQPNKKKKTQQIPSPPLDTFTNAATIVEEFVSVEVEPTPVESIQKHVVYPDSAKRYGLEGKVILSALIDTNGKVVKVEIDKSTNPIFDESARQAMMKTRLPPPSQMEDPFDYGTPSRLISNLTDKSSYFRNTFNLINFCEQ